MTAFPLSDVMGQRKYKTCFLLCCEVAPTKTVVSVLNVGRFIFTTISDLAAILANRRQLRRVVGATLERHAPYRWEWPQREGSKNRGSKASE